MTAFNRGACARRGLERKIQGLGGQSSRCCLSVNRFAALKVFQTIGKPGVFGVLPKECFFGSRIQLHHLHSTTRNQEVRCSR